MKEKSESLTSAELAKRGGVNLETIRYYERRGLLSPPARSTAGYRLFTSADAKRVRFIKRAQELGFSLNEILELLNLKVAPTARQGDVLKLAEAKIADLEERIESLRAMKRALQKLTTACCGGEAALSECPILASFERD